QLAANPSVAQAVSHPKGCSLAFGGPGDENKGHIDILARNGAAACSSRPRGADGRLSGYVGESWVRAAAAAPIFRAPLADKATGGAVAISAAPVARKAVVAGFLDLTSLGSSLESIYGGNRPTELLVTSRGSGTVVTRSVDPRRWIGRSVAGTKFARAQPARELDDLDGKRRIYASSAVP